MKTISLVKNAIHAGSLILINRDYPIYQVYQEKCENRLMPVSEKNNVQLERRAAAILQKLIEDKNRGEKIVAVSGFRSEYEQTQLYETSLTDNGVDFTAKYVALPNHSEHQTGLAVDLALNQPDIDAVRPYFPYTGDCGAFRNNAVNYGFIERYSKGKENITGIAHEPWHFRYVGAPHSRIIHEKNFTLEEYLVWLKNFPYGSEPFRYDFNGSAIEIFYIAADKEYTLFEIESNMPYSVSGDNMNGFIITKWGVK